MTRLNFVSMKSVALFAAVAGLSACKQDTANLEKKIDDLTTLVKNMPRGGGAAPGGGAQRPSRPEPDRAKTYAVPVDGEASDGPADAKITIVKASEYACPFCEKVRPTMDEIKKKYGNDVRLVYKSFVVHPATATAPALAVCAAQKQGKFVQMDEAIWEKVFKARNFDKDATAEAGGQPQKCWESAAGCPVVVGIANELQLNIEKFKSDMKGECQAQLQKGMGDLQRLGVAATPAFFINGRFLSGAQPLENFTALIDEELKKANDAIGKGTPAAEYYRQTVLDKGLKALETK
jgi:protein-disulfide isomerase